MAQNHLAKESKLSLAQGAVMLRDLEELARQDRDDVRQLKQKYLKRRGGGEDQGQDHSWADSCHESAESVMGDIIVCDDYHRHFGIPQTQPQPAAAQTPGWVKAAAGLGLVLGGAGVGTGLTAVLGRSATPVPAATAPVNTTVEKNTGLNLELVPPKESKP